MNTTDLQAETAPNSDAQVLSDDVQNKRTRRNRGREIPPERAPAVKHYVMDGKEVTRIELFGRVAVRMPLEQRYAVMDTEDWLRILAESDWWGIATGSSGNLFVARGTNSLAGKARQSDESHPNMPLARLIMNAKPGQRVVSISGDFRDLRKDKLFLADDSADEAKFRAVARAFEHNLTGA